MPPIGFAGIWRGRMHYAWIVLTVMFSATLAGVGVRAAPGVMIVPLQRAFGWDVATVSGAISLNIILLGATGPFLTGLIEVIGLKRTMASASHSSCTTSAPPWSIWAATSTLPVHDARPALPEAYTYIAILRKYQVNSAETALFAIAAAMSGFVRFGTTIGSGSRLSAHPVCVA